MSRQVVYFLFPILIHFTGRHLDGPIAGTRAAVKEESAQRKLLEGCSSGGTLVINRVS